jgi:formamidopyrimidine-DNA glycosylase
MPELPDLQVFSKNLTKALKGKTVTKAELGKEADSNVKKAGLSKALKGQKVENVTRSGKELLFAFANGHHLALHLMLRGNLYLFKGKNSHKSTLLELSFDDGSMLALADPFKKARIILDPKPPDAPDALSKKAGYDYLKEKLSATHAAIKSVLMDQHVLRGIGNAYADEILWDARISPFSKADKIPYPKIKKLAASIKSVLEKAEKQIQKEHPGIIHGEIRDFLKVHNPHKEKTVTGATIRHKNLSYRKTYYTDEQELF